MGEAGVTADLHTSSRCASSAAAFPAPLGFMEAERECLSFLLDLPSSPEASRLYEFLLPTVTGGQNLSCLETTQIILRVWKPWISLDFGRIVFLLEALGENPISLLTQVLKNSVAVACRAKVFVSLLALGSGCPWLLSAFLHMALHLRSSSGRLGSSHAWTLTSLCCISPVLFCPLSPGLPARECTLLLRAHVIGLVTLRQSKIIFPLKA